MAARTAPSRPLPMTALIVFLLACLAGVAGAALVARQVPTVGVLLCLAPLAALMPWVLEPPALRRGAGPSLGLVAASVPCLGLGEALLWLRVPESDPLRLGLPLLLAGAALAVAGLWRKGPEGADAPAMPLRRELALVAAAVAVGAAFRFWRLGDLPQGVWFDEALLGNTLCDQVLGAERQPLWLGGMVEHPTLWFWAAAPFVKLMGPQILALRLLSALLGTLALLPFYFLARQWFRPRVALAALLLFASMRWGFIFQRVGFMAPLATFWVVTGLAFLVRARRTQGVLDHALAGLCLGAALQSYVAAQAALPVMALWAAGVAVYDAPKGRRAASAAAFALAALAALAFGAGCLRGEDAGNAKMPWLLLAAGLCAASLVLYWRAGQRGMAALLAAAVLAATPVLVVAWANPGEVIKRAGQVSILSDVQRDGLRALGTSFMRHLGMFNFRGDYNGRHNLHYMPHLDGFMAALFVPALVWCHLRLGRDRRAALLAMLFWAVMAGGVFSVLVESPQAHRTMLLPVVVALMSGLALERLLEVLRGAFGGPRLPRGLAVCLLALLAAAPLANARDYFWAWASHPATYESYSPAATAIARRAAQSPAGWKVFVSRMSGEYTFYGYEAMELTRFMLRASGRRPETLNRVNALGEGNPPEGALLFWRASDEAELGAPIRAAWPDLPVEKELHPFTGQPLYFCMAVPAARIPRLKAAETALPPLFLTLPQPR